MQRCGGAEKPGEETVLVTVLALPTPPSMPIPLSSRLGGVTGIVIPTPQTHTASPPIMLPMALADALVSDDTDGGYDLIELPAGMDGAEHLRDWEPLIELLREQREASRFFGPICASPAVVLLPHGLLAGHRATCFPSFRAELDEAADVVASDERVVVDRSLVTSRGPGTAVAFALRLVTLLFDDETRAQEIQERMLVT